MPSGWTATFASPTLTVSPGASGSTRLQVTAPSRGTGGLYEVKVTVISSAGSATASASVMEMLVTH